MAHIQILKAHGDESGLRRLGLKWSLYALLRGEQPAQKLLLSVT